MLALLGFDLNRESRVLDFGCGSGPYVYEYRDAGYDAYGFDVVSAVELRRPEDSRYFGFSPIDKPANIPEYDVNELTYRIPFRDGFFDFVFSVSVFEHVMNYDLALDEIARVLRSGGTALHFFPARYSLIEPHIRVPLGGFITSFSWYLLWALLGVRNQFQDHLGPIGRAKINRHYARTGLNYLPPHKILQLACRRFSVARLVPEFYEITDDGKFVRRGQMIIRVPAYRAYYNYCKTVVLFLRK